MLSKTRSSIPTVHFKRPFLYPPELNVSTESTTNNNTSTRSDPPSRLRASLSLPESTQFHHSEALKTSAKMGFLCHGRQLHGHLTKMGLCNNVYLQSQIMNVYVKTQELNDAHKVFDEMSVRNVVVWNTLICSAIDNGSSLGISYFQRMLIEPARPDDITFNVLLRSCVASSDIESGEQLHCFALKLGFARDCFVAAALVDLYAKRGSVQDSRCAFGDASRRDSVLWNVMVYCYASNRLPREALGAFNSMRLEGFPGDEFTFAGLLTLPDIGTQVHGIAIKRRFEADVLVSSALVNMYSKSETTTGGCGDKARKVFDRMEVKNTVSWNTMIVGLRRRGEGREAIEFYQEMIRRGFSPDELTLASVASSCSGSGTSNELTQVHSRAIKSGFQSFVSVNNAMINAYSKCGLVDGAFRCFSSASESDLITWTSIIFAFAFHGLSLEATKYFEKMLTRGLNPDGIAFLGVLSACSHGGLVKQGLEYFETMTQKYQIVPNQEHYTCLVDLVGRAGLLEEAVCILNSAPFEATGGSALAALLGACRVHGNATLAEWAANKLFASEPNVAANYSVLSNAYSLEGRWHDVARVRRMMTRTCDPKSPGCSWVEISGETHTFVSSDRSHPKSKHVYDMLALVFLPSKEQPKSPKYSQTIIR